MPIETKTARQTPNGDFPMRIKPLTTEEMGPEALEMAKQVRRNFKLPEDGTIS